MPINEFIYVNNYIDSTSKLTDYFVDWVHSNPKNLNYIIQNDKIPGQYALFSQIVLPILSRLKYWQPVLISTDESKGNMSEVYQCREIDDLGYVEADICFDNVLMYKNSIDT